MFERQGELYRNTLDKKIQESPFMQRLCLSQTAGLFHCPGEIIMWKETHLIFCFILCPPTGHKKPPSSHTLHISPWTGPSYRGSLPGVPKIRIWKRKLHYFFLQKCFSHFLINKHKSSFNVGVLFSEIVYNGLRKVWKKKKIFEVC